MYVISYTVIEDRCIGITIRELCNIRDGIDHLPLDTNLKFVIESMCIILYCYII